MVRAWCVVVMGVVATLGRAGTGEWKTFTAKREVRAVTLDRGVVWAATGGGMFSFRFADSTFDQFTISEGLKTTDLTAIAADAQGTIWVGASNGFLHRYDPVSHAWQYVSDLFLRNDPSRRINRLQVSGDTLFIISDIGVSLFSISRMEFGDTYARFGAPPNQISGEATSLIFYHGSLWISTRNGIASTPITTSNPSAPESWQVYTSTQGLLSNNVTSLVVLADTLYAGTSVGISHFDTTVWNSIPGSAGLSILDMSFHPGCKNCVPQDADRVNFITSTQQGWFLGADSAEVSVAQLPYSLSSLSPVEPRTIGTISNGILLSRDADWIPTFPPSPPSNKFVGIAVDARGVLWSGTGTGNGDGFMRFDGKSWTVHTVATDGRLGSNNYYKVSIGKDDSKWVSNWGIGVALLDDKGAIRKILSPLNGIPSTDESNGPYAVVGGTAVDASGATWITNRTARGDTSLVIFKPDSTLGYIVGCGPGCTTRSPYTVFTDIVIDQYGTKWLANFGRFEPEIPSAFYFYNETYALPGSVFGWGKLTTNDGLTSNKVYAMCLDRDQQLWLGSDQGITIIFNTADPYGSMALYHPLNDQVIQGILADPLNNKWVATRNGAFVLSSDGTEVLQHYTVENTDGKLLDNDVASIAINPSTGAMYFGTEKGLSMLSTPSVEPNRTLDQLSVRPNPFYLPSSDVLTVDGLVQGSTLKILTVDGTLVREVQSPGGRIGFWDGKDKLNHLVSTGIYLVVAYSEDGSQVASTKVAIIRK